MRRLLKNFRLSALGVFRVPRTAKMAAVEVGVFLCGVQLKRHNFGWWESYWGLVDIPTIAFCTWVLVGEVWFGRYEPMLINKFWRSPCRWLHCVL